MLLFGRKLRQVADTEGVLVGMAFICPGCDQMHVAYVKAPCYAPTRDTWGFNWNEVAPTFTPSYLVRSERWEPPVTPENLTQWRENPWTQTRKPYICHSFITDGRIQYLDDCTHHLAGQTVDLPDIPERV